MECACRQRHDNDDDDDDEFETFFTQEFTHTQGEHGVLPPLKVETLEKCRESKKYCKYWCNQGARQPARQQDNKATEQAGDPKRVDDDGQQGTGSGGKHARQD